MNLALPDHQAYLDPTNFDMIYNFGQVLLVGEGVGVRAHGSTLCNTQQIAAHIGLDREVSGHYCSVHVPHTHILLFFLKARRAVMGPAKRGPIWVPRRGTHYRSRFIFLFFVVARPLAFGSLPAPMHHPKGGAYVHPEGVHII